MRLTIEHYVATNNPIQVQAVLDKYGVSRAKDMSDMLKKVNYVIIKHKDFAMNDLAKIDTPYKRLILANIPKPEPTPAPVTFTPTESASPIPTESNTSTEKKSNACGCSSSADGSEEKSNCCGSGFDGEEKSNCSGCEYMKKSSGIDGTETKGAAPKKEEPKKETVITKQEEKSKTDYMPLAILGIIAVAVIVVAKI